LSHKTTAFYRGKTAVHVGFSAESISSDGALVLLEKLERKHKLISHFAAHIPDTRDQARTDHSIFKMLKQHVFSLMQGYEDANDVEHLKNDPLFEDVLDGKMASQPTISRFENGIDHRIIWDLCTTWVDRYITSLKGRDTITIDIDATDDPTHGNQQLSMFNGFYGQFMYNELFFHDGHTGQIIVPILRPGNSHSNKWYVSILKRVVKKIRQAYPEMGITIRADSGFNGSAFYELADQQNLDFVIGLATNAVLKGKTARAEKAVMRHYVHQGTKHQHFFTHTYKAKSWHKAQICHTKVESTGKGLNVRHIVSNMPEKDARKVYLDFYVQRGEASENRIKEIKNMCFSDRLSCHRFWSNFARLFISSLAYEMFLLIKQAIGKTTVEEAQKWCVDTIRTRLLKIGATIKKTVRRVYYQLSKAFVYQELFRQLIYQ
jgi:hypothetical protein